jgi:hypothetical protein
MNPSGMDPINDTDELAQDDHPLRQARLELSELQHLIADIDDPGLREQLAGTARRLGAYLHAGTVDSVLARPAFDAERYSWLATILRTWTPDSLAGLRPDTTDDDLAPTAQRWARRAAHLAAHIAGRWYCCEHHSDCPEPGSEATESGERYCPAHFPDPPVNILDRT